MSPVSPQELRPMTTWRERRRAYLAMLRVEFAESTNYRATFIVWALQSTMPLIMLAVWWAATEDGPIRGLGPGDFAAYYLASLAVRQLTASWLVWGINGEIRSGRVMMRLMRPVHPFLAYSAQSLAQMPLRLMAALPPLLLALLWLGSTHFTDDPLLLGLFLVSLAGAWLCEFAILVTIGTLGLLVESSIAIYQVWLGIHALLSGYLIPLAMMPEGVRGAVAVLPFRYLLSFPIEVLLGSLARGEALRHLGMQWAYTFGFLGLALFVWRAGLRRYQAYGG